MEDGTQTDTSIGKKIKVKWPSHHPHGSYYKCWDAGEQHGVVIPYARDCHYSQKDQDWWYNEHGQIYNRHYNKCITYNYNDSFNYNYGGYKYAPLYLYDCHPDWANQKFLYVHEHWVSAYDGLCVDLYRDGGGYFHMNHCNKYWSDQIHDVEDYWFYPWYH